MTTISANRRKSRLKTSHIFAAVFTATFLGACSPMAKAAVSLLTLAG